MQKIFSKKHRMNSTKLWRFIIGAAALGMFLWAIVPLCFSGVFNIGVIVPAVAGFSVFLCCICFRTYRRILSYIWERKLLRRIWIFMEIVIAALLVLFIVVSGIMLHAAAKVPPENATVIVLGAALRGDQPSTMLASRLKSAAKYLEKNPESKCVVSGGQGADEDYPEALVMRNYLVEKFGIDESRIFMESTSINTYQNIELSKALIEKEKLNSSVVIATQEFHQYRAQTFAKRAGFQEIGACTCQSPGYLLGCYWVREFVAISRMTLLGY
jgi:uncharacterized SAM-binding protein YcdF (DUF218 family)